MRTRKPVVAEAFLIVLLLENCNAHSLKPRRARAPKDTVKTSHAQKPAPTDALQIYRHHFNDTILQRFLKPDAGNLKSLKWRANQWKNMTKSPNGTGGNWTKGYRTQGQWNGSDGHKGSWFSQGVVKGLWSLTEALGHWIFSQFWTCKSSAQLNVTLGQNLAAVFTLGNWSNGNLTYEADNFYNLVKNSSFIGA